MASFNINDRLMLAAIALLFAGALAYGAAFDGLWIAVIGGCVLLAAAIGFARASQGGLMSQVALPVIGMAMVGLTIDVARGRSEAHFAVFALLAVTVVYRSWIPVIAGAATIAVHHVAFNYIQQWGWGPVCFTEPSLARVIEHALFVVAEAGVLIILAQRARADFAAAKELNGIADRLVAKDGAIDFATIRSDSKIPSTRKMLDALTQIERSIATVRATTDSISTAANEIAAGSQDLSARTEDAASNLQETAGSMAQLTGAVNQTAESAGTANRLAASAAEVAERGGRVVSEVVTTMNEINASARKIADIIGVIDGIAFQTNILALNAAVEAARAGEQGRGFAVVASEVRGLAHRSAEAAREIKQLIHSSVERVENGSKLVTEAGTTMSGIVAAAKQVSDVIGGISAAAAEQSHGIGRMNGSVAQLDQMTQQNAALVEQSTAAAESLKDQSKRLGEAVAAFHLSGAAA